MLEGGTETISYRDHQVLNGTAKHKKVVHIRKQATHYEHSESS